MILCTTAGRFGGIRASTQLRTWLSELGMIHIPSVLGTQLRILLCTPYRVLYNNTHCILVHGKIYRICRNKGPGSLIFRSNKKTFQNPTNPIGFMYSPPLKNHPSQPIGFMYSPLWKITHQSSSVLCTPPFEKSPIKAHRFCVLPPLKNHCFWWALISGWVFILANMVFEIYFFFSCSKTAAIPKVEDTITKDGKTNNQLVLDSTSALLDELVWFARAIKEHAKVKIVMHTVGLRWRWKFLRMNRTEWFVLFCLLLIGETDLVQGKTVGWIALTTMVFSAPHSIWWKTI